MTKFFNYNIYHISILDLFLAFITSIRSLFIPIKKKSLETNIKKIWKNKNILICQSFRTGFDIVLQYINPHPESEIIITTLTIQDIPKLAKYHGMKVIPWDIDLETTFPILSQLEFLLTKKTKIVVLTHLFGIKIDREVVKDICKKIKRYNKNIFIIEDLAQSFYELKNNKHPLTDVAIFSFESSKNYTSLKGGIVDCKNKELKNALTKINNTYPVWGIFKFIKYIFLAFAVVVMTRPRISFWIVKFLKFFGTDHEKFGTKYFRAYPIKNENDDQIGNLISNIRLRPTTSQLFLVQRRLLSIPDKHMQKRKSMGIYATKIFNNLNPKVFISGHNAVNRHFWIVSIIVNLENKLVEKLRCNLIKNGYGVTSTASTFDCIYEQNKMPKNGILFQNKVIYLPITVDITKKDINKMYNLIYKFIKIN